MTRFVTEYDDEEDFFFDDIKVVRTLAPVKAADVDAVLAAEGLDMSVTPGKTLTLTAADNYTLTIPASGTAALLGTANIFTAGQTIRPVGNAGHLIVAGTSFNGINILNNVANDTARLCLSSVGAVANKMGAEIILFGNPGMADPANFEGLVIQAGSSRFDSYDYFIAPMAAGTGKERTIWLGSASGYGFEKVLGIFSPVANHAYAEFDQNVIFGAADIPDCAIDVRAGWIAQSGAASGIRTYGLGDHSAPNTGFAGVNFSHNGTLAILNSFAGGGTEKPRDFVWFLGDTWAASSRGLKLTRNTNNSGDDWIEVVGASTDGLRFSNSPGDVSYYKMGRNGGTGYFEVYGAQSGYNGYIFRGVDRTFLTMLNNGNIAVGSLAVPAVKLDIYTGTNALDTSAALGAGIRISAGAGAKEDAYINFWGDFLNNGNSYGAGRIHSGTNLSSSGNWNDSYIALQTHALNSAAWTDDVVIKAGKVGINNDHPTYTLDITGNARITTGFGCNGTNPQTAYASGGAVTPGAGAYGFDSAQHAADVATLLNNIRAALVANGIMS